MNPANGPNWGTDTWKLASYNACISYLRTNGVKVVGYVHTKVGYPSITGYRTLQDVIDDMEQWNTDYSTIDGIFVDEVTNIWPDTNFDSKQDTLDFYGDVISNIASTNSNWITVLNPGGPYFADLTIGQTGVLSVLFEDAANKWNPTSCAAI